MSGMAASATLHCLTGCAIGEIVGMTVGTALGWANLATTALAFALAFVRARSFCAVPVIVAEGSGFRPAVARSKLLSVGYVGELAGIWFAVRGTMVVLLVPLLAVPWFLSDITGTQRVAAIGLLGGAFLLGASKNPLSLIFSLGGFVALILLAQAVATGPAISVVFMNGIAAA